MPNHLSTESSPYLLQHVNNPVDWYPWGDEALGISAKQDRPIFLSIGYSACHWCHVMEHESFENSDIAGLMNEWFVCIKVDREERPDLDQIYMNAVQAMTGSGGWPMSVFLTPDQKPFYGGTYWPPTARWGRPGFREILAGVHEAWQNRRSAVDAQADELAHHLQQVASPSVAQATLGEQTLRKAMRSIVQAADKVNGGFGSAPKFPHPMDLRLGMRCWKRFSGIPESRVESAEVLQVVTLTLDKMARGGIYDHLGGGFARYSTDERWLVPHFEKMLYDNAQLVPAYLEAYQITGRLDFAQVARETLDYVLREMTQPQGGFYSTQDADSEGMEGKFFVWSEVEVDAILDAAAPNAPDVTRSDDATSTSARKSLSTVFKYCYDVTAHGNWEHSNILNRPKSTDQAAKTLAFEPAELESLLAFGRQTLFNVRSQRIWPGRDEKVLVSWNGLMIGAMAIASSVLNEPRYAEAAVAAADFILAELVEEVVDGAPNSNEIASQISLNSQTGIDPVTGVKTFPRLLHGYKDGRARFNAYLDDYAAMIDGLCEVYQAVFDAKYLDAALGLAERMIQNFWDPDSGGFFYTSTDHETLIARNKDTQDNATPSGNSLAAIGLMKLARLTGRTDLDDKAVAILEMLSGQLERNPLAAGLSLMALDFQIGPAHEIVLAQGTEDSHGSGGDQTGIRHDHDRQVLSQIHRRFIPNKVIHWRTADASDDRLPNATQMTLRGKTALQNKTTAYVCDHGVCRPPICGEQNLATMIETL